MSKEQSLKIREVFLKDVKWQMRKKEMMHE